MKTGDLLDCPFCDFTDHDHYFLLQHVETIHSESGHPSPFVVRQELTQQPGPPADEMEGSSDDASEYTECQCGEFCLLTEFESHLEMHYAEGMGVDETLKFAADVAVPASAPYPGQAPHPQMEPPLSTPLPAFSTSGSSRPLPSRALIERSHRSTSQKSSNPVRDFIDVLRHSTSPPSRKPAQAARSRLPRRLGVRDSNFVFSK